MSQITKNFTTEEVACKHCGQVLYKKYLVRRAQYGRNRLNWLLQRSHLDKYLLPEHRNKEGRKLYEVRISVVSGYRCKIHNTKIYADKGLPPNNSPHMYGLALDLSAYLAVLGKKIYLPNTLLYLVFERYQLQALLLSGKSVLHIDIDKQRVIRGKGNSTNTGYNYWIFENTKF